MRNEADVNLGGLTHDASALGVVRNEADVNLGGLTHDASALGVVRNEADVNLGGLTYDARALGVVRNEADVNLGGLPDNGNDLGDLPSRRARMAQITFVRESVGVPPRSPFRPSPGRMKSWRSRSLSGLRSGGADRWRSLLAAGLVPKSGRRIAQVCSRLKPAEPVQSAHSLQDARLIEPIDSAGRSVSHLFGASRPLG